MEKQTLDQLWEETQKGIVYSKITIPEPLPEKQQDFIRFVFISDTHEAPEWENNVPNGDVLIHCGDFTMLGGMKETKDFVSKFEKQPHKIKIVVAGNHEMTFDTEKFKMKRQVIGERFRFLRKVDDVKVKEVVTLNTNLIYLENVSIDVLGYKIYGSPVQPHFYDWAFNVRRERIAEVWKQIPADTEILITHGPPLGFGDLTEENEHRGCADLLDHIRNRIKPKIHAFGHIHHSYGVWKDENTIYVNAAICDINYNAMRMGVAIDLPVKK